MVDYAQALKRPFSDIKKFILGMIISIIPIVNFLFLGYILKVAKSAMNNDMKLPEWKDLGSLFVNGIKAIIIGLVYMIPYFVLLGVAMFTGLLTFSGLNGSTYLAYATWLLGAGITGIVTIIVGILFGLLGIAAMLRFASTEQFGAAFEFNSVMSKAFTGTFIGGWILTMVIGFAISFVLGLIPIIGPIVSVYIVSIFMYTALGQIYSEA